MGNNIKLVQLSLLLTLALGLVSSHSTLYPHISKDRKKAVPFPGIISYHIHLTYTVFNPPVITAALAIREEARRAFKHFLGPDCDGRYDYGYLCMIADHNFNTTLIGGPFTSGEWSIFVPVGYYSVVIPWMLQHRGDFSIVVHPNTGYEYEDHSKWAMWVGERWPLDMTIFDENTQTNEFDHYPGDANNPICLAKNGVCGDSVFGLGPVALCCYNLTCATAEKSNTQTIYRCK